MTVEVKLLREIICSKIIDSYSCIEFILLTCCLNRAKPLAESTLEFNSTQIHRWWWSWWWWWSSNWRTSFTLIIYERTICLITCCEPRFRANMRRTVFVSSFLMTRTLMVLETLVYSSLNHFTRLLAWEYFIEHIILFYKFLVSLATGFFATNYQ
jgi:hypothetical protein